MELTNIWGKQGRLKKDTYKAFLHARSRAALKVHAARAERRKEDYRLFRGRVLGEVQPKQAKVVASHAQDTIEALLPDLMELVGTPDAVQILPDRRETTEVAERLQKLFDYQQEHELDWFMFLYLWIKSGLLWGQAYCEWGWDSRVVFKEIRFKSITWDDFARIKMDGGEFISGEMIPTVDPMTGMQRIAGFHNCVMKERVVEKHGPYVECVPPEDIIIDEGANSIDEATFVIRILHRTVDQVIKEGNRRGYDKKAMRALIAHGKNMATNGGVDDFVAEEDRSDERADRFDQMGFEDPRADMQVFEGAEGLAPVDIYRIYTWLDVDNDGEMEPVMFMYCPQIADVLAFYENPYERIPVEELVPIPDPHQPNGVSIPQLVEQSQRIVTALMRGVLDYFKMSLNPMKIAETNRGTDLTALRLGRAGDVVTTNPGGLNSIKWVDPPPFPAPFFNFLQWLQDRDDHKTGLNAYNQGMDSKSLNKTARGISQMMQAAHKRVSLMGQLVLRGGIRKLAKRMIWLNQNFLSEPKTLYIASVQDDITVDPAQLRGQVKISVKVAPGGGRQAALEAAQRVLQLQKEIGSSPYGPQMIFPHHLFNAAREILAREGYFNHDEFIGNPMEAMNGGQGAGPVPPGAGGAHPAGPGGPGVPGLGGMAGMGQEMAGQGAELVGQAEGENTLT